MAYQQPINALPAWNGLPLNLQPPHAPIAGGGIQPGYVEVPVRPNWVAPVPGMQWPRMMRDTWGMDRFCCTCANYTADWNAFLLAHPVFQNASPKIMTCPHLRAYRGNANEVNRMNVQLQEYHQIQMALGVWPFTYL